MNKFAVGLGVMGLGVFLLGSAAEAASATRIQKSFNNWRVDCAEVENKSRRCALQYSLVSKKNKQVVFSWSVIPKNKEGTSPPQAIIRTPTGVALSDGISVVFAGGEPIKVQYKTCGARGCIAEVDFSDAWVKAFGSKPTVTVNYKAVTGTPIKHDLDLKNFQEAYAFYVQQMKTPIQ
jgi:invasion protein IalB